MKLHEIHLHLHEVSVLDQTGSASGNAYMKLQLLLQKCRFFLIKLAAFQASGDAH